MGTGFTAPGRSGPGASSNVRLPGPGGRVSQNWVAISQLAAGLAGQTAAAAELRGVVANLKPIARRLDQLHPFKIYQVPDVLRETPDPETDWLKFLVRAGRVMETDADGTDAVDSDPDSETYPATPGEITVPVNTEKFWFWLEIGVSGGATTAVVRYGPDPTADSYEEDWTSDNPWTGAPAPDAGHIPIGWVDTDTAAADRVAIVRQLLRTDVGQVSGGVTLMSLVAYAPDDANGDYLVCRPLGGNVDGSDDVEVGVEPQLQTDIAKAKTPDGSVWEYTYTGAQVRTAHCASGPASGGSDLTEYITPPFGIASPGDSVLADMIPVQYCGNTSVFVDGVELTLIALTGRQWASA